MIPQPIVSRSVARAISAEVTVEDRASIWCLRHQGYASASQIVSKPARSSACAVAIISSTGSMVSCMTPMRNGGVTEAYSHAVATIRRYRPEDLEQCRSLWTDLTEWHRQLYADESIGGARSGLRASTRTWRRSGRSGSSSRSCDGRVVAPGGNDRRGRKVELEPLSVRAGCRGLGDGPPWRKSVARGRARGRCAARSWYARPAGTPRPSACSTRSASTSSRASSSTTT